MNVDLHSRGWRLRRMLALLALGLARGQSVYYQLGAERIPAQFLSATPSYTTSAPAHSRCEAILTASRVDIPWRAKKCVRMRG